MATNPVLDLSAKQLKQAAALRERIEALETQLTKLLTQSGAPAKPGKQASVAVKRPPRKPRKKKMSAAFRAKMSKALKRRWAKAKASGKKSL